MYSKSFNICLNLILFLLLQIFHLNSVKCECEILFNTPINNFNDSSIISNILLLNHASCLEKIISLERKDILHSYISILKTKSIDYSNIISQILKYKNQRISEIKQKFLSNSNVDYFIQPFFKWAEKNHYIFLQISFKKKENSELICDKLEEESFEFLSDSNNVHFEGYCYDKNKQLNKLELNLELYDIINKLKSLYTNQTPNEKGKFTVILYKTVNKGWPRLLYNNMNEPDNMRKWEEYGIEFKQIDNNNIDSIKKDL